MIDELKQNGWDVDVIHERVHDWNYDSGKEMVVPRGGRTIVVLTNKHDHNAVAGVAICSEHDNYCRETGRNIALTRALVQLPEFRAKVPNLFVE